MRLVTSRSRKPQYTGRWIVIHVQSGEHSYVLKYRSDDIFRTGYQLERWHERGIISGDHCAELVSLVIQLNRLEEAITKESKRDPKERTVDHAITCNRKGIK